MLRRQGALERAYLREMASRPRRAPPPAPSIPREFMLGATAVDLHDRGFTWEQVADALNGELETIRRHAVRFIAWRARQALAELTGAAQE